MEATAINKPTAIHKPVVSESTEMDVMREVQSRRRKITVEEYALMTHTGVFHPDERVELIEGELIQMAPMKSPHIAQVMRLSRLLIEKLNRKASVAVQLPVVLGEHSEPEPDFSILA